MNEVIDMSEIIGDKNAQEHDHKVHVMKAQECGFGERLSCRISELEYKHGHKLPIGVKPLSLNEKLELHGRLNKEYDTPDTEDWTPRTKELLERTTREDRYGYTDMGSMGFQFPTTLKGYHEQQKMIIQSRKIPDDFGGWKQELKEQREKHIEYNKKYDIWGMRNDSDLG